MTKHPQGAAAVTQEDRDAAARTVFPFDDPFEADSIRRGEADNGRLVQEFARHRIAALSRSGGGDVGQLRAALTKVAEHVTTMSRESTGSGDMEALEGVAKDCIPIFESVGMSNEGDGWGFSDDDEPALSSSSTVRDGIEASVGESLGGPLPEEEGRARLDAYADGCATGREAVRDEVLEEAARVAETTKLPDGYIWSRGNHEKFEFGAEEAAKRIRRLKSSVAVGPDNG